MKIGIIDIGIGNLKSIQNMLGKSGIETVYVSDREELKQCDKIVLPGMGSFDKCMIALNQSGLRDELESQVLEIKKPFLGICVGLQMLMRKSEEGTEPGLNWIDGETVKFAQSRLAPHQKIPNLGWLDISIKHNNRLSEKLEDSRFYFAHTYHVSVDNKDDEWISALYGYEFTAAISKGNIFGVQFHPEKSHRFGMQLLFNFAELA